MKGRGPNSSVNSLRCYYPRVLFITAIFPIAAAAAMQLGEALHQLDARDVRRHLVAELPLEERSTACRGAPSETLHHREGSTLNSVTESRPKSCSGNPFVSWIPAVVTVSASALFARIAADARTLLR